MPGDLAERVAQALSKTPTVNRMVGVFVAHEGNLAVVDVAGEQIRIPMAGAAPLPGLPVWVESQNGRYVCTGVSRQLSATGTVVNASATVVRVVPDGGEEVELPYLEGLTPTSGDRVVIDTTSYVVSGVLSSEKAEEPAPTPAPPPDTVFHQLLVQATDSGSTNGGGWWTGDVYTMSSTAGAWFYGGGLQAALRGVKTFSSVEIYLPVTRDAGWVAPTLNLHTMAGKPGSGFLGYGAAHSLPSRSGWVSLPVDWGTVFRDTVAGVGAPTHPSTNTIWRGKQADAMSGALRFSGSR